MSSWNLGSHSSKGWRPRQGSGHLQFAVRQELWSPEDLLPETGVQSGAVPRSREGAEAKSGSCRMEVTCGTPSPCQSADCGSHGVVRHRPTGSPAPSPIIPGGSLSGALNQLWVPGCRGLAHPSAISVTGDFQCPRALSPVPCSWPPPWVP